MDVAAVVREIVTLCHPLDPIQFTLVKPDGTEEPLWVDARAPQLVARSDRADAPTSVRLETASFQEAVKDDKLLLQHGLWQLFLKRKITVEGQFASFLAFVAGAHKWQCPPRPVTRRKGAPVPAPPPKPGRPASERVSKGQPRLTEIERRPFVPKDEFHAEYVAKGRPVIMTEPAKKWRVSTMSFPELTQRLAPYQGIVRSGGYSRTGPKEYPKNFSGVPLDEYIASLEELGGGDFPPYAGNIPIPRELYDLFEFPDYFPKEIFDLPKMWIGPAGTVTPLHRDVLDNFFCQVSGVKRWIIVAPDESDYVYCTPPDSDTPNYAEVDIEKPDLEKFPLVSKANLVKFDIHPGELLWLPEGWFHCVRSLTPSISINLWLFNKRI